MLQLKISLGNKSINHERQVFTFIDLMGNLGGVFDLLVFIFGIFVAPISEHSFILKFLQRLYILHSSEIGVFNPISGSPTKKNSNKLKHKNLKYKIPQKIINVKEYFPINISTWESIKLFFYCKGMKSRKMNAQLSMIKKGKQKIDEDLSIERVIKHVRDTKIWSKMKGISLQEKFMIQYHKRNVIDIDSDTHFSKNKENINFENIQLNDLN